MTYTDRSQAGSELAKELQRFQAQNPYVLAIPKGGVEVAYQVSRDLNTPLDIIGIRKMSFATNPNIEFGAIAPGDVVVYNDELIDRFGMSSKQLDRVRYIETRELSEMMYRYRGDRDLLDFDEKTVIVIDDGTSSELSVLASVRYLKRFKNSYVVFASPYSSSRIRDLIANEADEVIILSDAHDQNYLQSRDMTIEDIRLLLLDQSI